VFGSDGDREALVEDVLDEADDEQLLFEDREHLSHGLDAVEDLATREEPPMKTCSPSMTGCWACKVLTASRTKSASWSRRDGTCTRVSSDVLMSNAFSWRDASITSLGVAAKLGVRLCLTTEPSENTVTRRWWCASRFTNCTLKIVALRVRCADDDRGVARHLAQQRRGLFQDLFDLAAHAGEELLHLLLLDRAEDAGLQMVHEVAIALVGRDSDRPTCGAGRGSPLALGRPSQSARSPKRRRGRRSPPPPRSRPLGGVDVFDDDGLENRRFSGVEVHDNLRGCANIRGRAIPLLV